jgi:putative selenium metabolism hydrolase
MPSANDPSVDGDALVEFLLGLIAEPSLSGQEGGVARLVAAEMDALGLRTEVDELGNVLGTLDAGPGPCVLIDSHMDTVGVTEPSAWSYPPSGERVDGRVYGRGAMDMKGPLAASVYGVAALTGTLEHGRVIVCASIAEELVEGPALVAVAKRVRPDAVVICESTSLMVARGQRGRAEIQVEIHGVPTHSSRPDLGVNAVERMADLIVGLREITLPRHDVLGSANLVLTDIVSSPYPGLSVVPDRCVATFDRRTLPGESEDDVLAPVRSVLESVLDGTGASGSVRVAVDDFTSYTGARVQAPNFAPAWFHEADEPHVRGALEGLRGAGLSAEMGHYAFCTNGSGTARLGLPTLGFGPGDESLAHRVNEYIDVSELEAGARGYAAIAAALVAALG